MRRGWSSALPILLVVTLLSAPLAGAAHETPASTGTPPGAGSSGNGTLTLSVTPATAAVTVNGTAVHAGTTGFANVSLASGQYVVRATAAGDQEFQGNVTILTGQVAYLTIHLVPTAGAGAKSPFWSGYVLPIAITVLAVLGLFGLALYIRRQNRRPEPPPSAPARPSTPESVPAEDGPE